MTQTNQAQFGLPMVSAEHIADLSSARIEELRCALRAAVSLKRDKSDAIAGFTERRVVPRGFESRTCDKTNAQRWSHTSRPSGTCTRAKLVSLALRSQRPRSTCAQK